MTKSPVTRTTTFGPLEIADAHTHFFSRNFFAKLTSQSPAISSAADPFHRAAELTGWVMPPQDSAELAMRWKAELDKHHVSSALMIASVPDDEMSIAAAVSACPDRIIGAFMFDPTKPEPEARIELAFDEMNLRVACLFPAMHHYSVAECEGARIAAAVASARPETAVLIHCGVLSVGARKKLGLPSLFDLRYSNPLDVYKLAAEFPKARFIIPHFGAGMFREALMLADLCPNVYLDTSSSNKWMHYEAAHIDLKTVFERALEVVGHERLLFGTDSSFFPRGWHSAVFEAQHRVLQEIGISGEQAMAIFGGNLRKLLGIN
jgi:hypothetical protein